MPRNFLNEIFKVKAKNAMIALAIMSIFNAEIGKLHQKISDNLKQKWYQ